jgi:hypothetical protein
LERISVDPNLTAEAQPRVKKLLRDLRYERALSLDRPLGSEDLRFIRHQAPEAYDELVERYGFPKV